MPIYLYECAECGHRFESLVTRLEEADTVLCPECGASPERQLTSFAVGARQREAEPAAPHCNACGLDRPPCGQD